MTLCDTNILIEFYKNNPHIIQALHSIGPNDLAISAITQAELCYGALNKAELRKIKRHLSLIHSYPIDQAISQHFVTLMEAYSLSPN
jgi:predicted nucleic acid-binding protein